MLWWHTEGAKGVRGMEGRGKWMSSSVGGLSRRGPAPSTSASPSRSRRPASRSPAFSADSVLENVKLDFAQEDFFFCFFFLAGGSRSRRCTACTDCTAVSSDARPLVCACTRACPGLVLSHTSATSPASVSASPAGIEGTPC